MVEMCTLWHCMVGMYLLGHCGRDVPTLCLLG